MSDQKSSDLREEVRSRYAQAARAVLEPEAGVTASCCGSSAADSCCGTVPAGTAPAGAVPAGTVPAGAVPAGAAAVGGFSEHQPLNALPLAPMSAASLVPCPGVSTWTG